MSDESNEDESFFFKPESVITKFMGRTVLNGEMDNELCESFTYDYTNKVLTISGEVMNYDCVSPFADIDKDLKTLILDGYTTIANGAALEDMFTLEKIVIPQTVTRINPKTVGYVLDESGSSGKKLDNLTIYGYPGTVAESYANENGFRATPHNSARAICEAIFRQNKARKRRNTLCISSFRNAVMAENCRKAPQAILCGVALGLLI